jgi:hypothetical protein
MMLLMRQHLRVQMRVQARLRKLHPASTRYSHDPGQLQRLSVVRSSLWLVWLDF